MVPRQVTASYDLIVVGGGPAGIHAALAFHKRQPGGRVLIVEDEPELGYYRPLLPMFMTGKLGQDRLFFWRPGEQPGIVARTGDGAVALDRANRSITLRSGASFHYRKLILAQGGRPIVPPVFAGQEWPRGVFAVRNLTEACRIKEWLTHHSSVVVLGGGLVGSKTSVYLALAGFEVTLVEKERHILPTVLSADAAAPLQRHIEHLGVTIRTSTSVDAFEADSAGAICAARLTTGEMLPCQTFLIGIGGTPAVEFLAGTGLLDGNGHMVISPDQRTCDPDILAIGDVVTIRDAEGREFQPWTWPQAVIQGRLAGANTLRQAPLPVTDTTRVNAQNVAGIPLMILGGPTAGDCSSVVSRPDPDPGIWREFYTEGSRIVGGSLIGDIAGAGPLHYAMALGRDVGERASDLLRRRTRAIADGAWHRLAQRPVTRQFDVERETR